MRTIRCGRWEVVWWGWRSALKLSNYSGEGFAGWIGHYFAWAWGPFSLRRYR